MGISPIQLISILLPGLTLGFIYSLINKNVGKGFAIFSGVLGSIIGSVVFINASSTPQAFPIGAIIGALVLLFFIHLVKRK